MAELKEKTYDHRTTPTKSSRFLCCFGFPEKKYSQSKETTTAVGSDHYHDYDRHHHRRKKITLCLSFSGLRVKSNRTSIKTVPVLLDGSPAPEKPQRAEIKAIHYWSKPKPKSKSKTTDDDDQQLTKNSSNIIIPPDKPRDQQAPHNQPPSEIQTLVTAAPDQSPKEIKPVENPNLDNLKHSGRLNSSKDDTCQKRLSFSRKIEAIRTGSSQPGSPLNSKPKKPVRAMRHSESFPAGPKPNKPRSVEKKAAVREREPAAVRRRFEPLVGMSVVMVTLVIMVLWGRLCAILCTSAWLYFVPRLSSAVVDPAIDGLGAGSGQSGLDLGSEERKKKVVFEGFLERNNHRSSL